MFKPAIDNVAKRLASKPLLTKSENSEDTLLNKNDPALDNKVINTSNHLLEAQDDAENKNSVDSYGNILEQLHYNLENNSREHEFKATKIKIKRDKNRLYADISFEFLNITFKVNITFLQTIYDEAKLNNKANTEVKLAFEQFLNTYQQKEDVFKIRISKKFTELWEEYKNNADHELFSLDATPSLAIALPNLTELDTFTSSLAKEATLSLCTFNINASDELIDIFELPQPILTTLHKQKVLLKISVTPVLKLSKSKEVIDSLMALPSKIKQIINYLADFSEFFDDIKVLIEAVYEIYQKKSDDVADLLKKTASELVKKSVKFEKTAKAFNVLMASFAELVKNIISLSNELKGYLTSFIDRLIYGILFKPLQKITSHIVFKVAIRIFGFLIKASNPILYLVDVVSFLHWFAGTEFGKDLINRVNKFGQDLMNDVKDYTNYLIEKVVEYVQQIYHEDIRLFLEKESQNLRGAINDTLKTELEKASGMSDLELIQNAFGVPSTANYPSGAY
ncbi:MAG: hypothetical protein Tsb005_17750 [Gammaproteobacteria bacterium]